LKIVNAVIETFLNLVYRIECEFGTRNVVIVALSSQNDCLL